MRWMKPAGVKPSGLPAGVQEARAQLEVLRLRNHALDLMSPSYKSSAET